MTAHILFLAAASLFSAETQDVTPVTTPGNSQVGTEPKPPVSETPSWTTSDRSDSSTIVANSVDDPATFEHGRDQGRVIGQTRTVTGEQRSSSITLSDPFSGWGKTR